MTDIPARQIPPPGVLFLDHIAHFVPDMAAAAATLEALGFALTPWSEQSNRDAEGRSVPAGSANRCVMLDAGYLEVLTPTADTPIAAQIRAANKARVLLADGRAVDAAGITVFPAADPATHSVSAAAAHSSQPAGLLKDAVRAPPGAVTAGGGAVAGEGATGLTGAINR